MNSSQEDSRPFHARINAGVGEGEAQHSEDLGTFGEGTEGTFRGISPTAYAFDNFNFNSNKGSNDDWVRRTLTPELPNVSESHTISRTGNVDGGLRFHAGLGVHPELRTVPVTYSVPGFRIAADVISHCPHQRCFADASQSSGENLDGLIALYRQKKIFWKGWKQSIGLLQEACRQYVVHLSVHPLIFNPICLETRESCRRGKSRPFPRFFLRG